MRFVSASELARFSYCEMQWALERWFGFREMSDHELAHLARRGKRRSDPQSRAVGTAAAAYLEHVRPAMRQGERYHSEDARQRTKRPRAIATVVAILVVLALLAITFR